MVAIARISKKTKDGHKKIKTKYFAGHYDDNGAIVEKWTDDIDAATTYSKYDALEIANTLSGNYFYSLIFDVDFNRIKENKVKKINDSKEEKDINDKLDDLVDKSEDPVGKDSE